MVWEKSDFGKSNCSVCRDQGFGFISINQGAMNDYAKQQGEQYLMSQIGLPAMPSLSTLWNIASAAKDAAANVCAAKNKVVGLITQGLMQTISSASGMPFFMLQANVPGLLSCDEGRAMISGALYACISAYRGGSTDILLGIGDLNSDGSLIDAPYGTINILRNASGYKNVYPSLATNDSRSDQRRHRFADLIVDALSIGLDMQQGIEAALSRLGREAAYQAWLNDPTTQQLSSNQRDTYIAQQFSDVALPSNWTTSSYNQNPMEFRDKAGYYLNALTPANIAYVRSKGADGTLSPDELNYMKESAGGISSGTPFQWIGAYEMKLLLESCLLNLVRDIAKNTDPANYNQFASDAFKQGDYSYSGIFASKSLAWLFALSGLLALGIAKKGKA